MQGLSLVETHKRVGCSCLKQEAQSTRVLCTLLYILDSLIFPLLLCLQPPCAHLPALAVSLLWLSLGFLSSHLIVAECHSLVFLLIEFPCM